MDALAVLHAPALTAAFERSADSSTARAAIERIVEANPSVADDLLENDLVRDALVAIACASRSLVAAIVSDGSLLDVLRDEHGLHSERDVIGYRGSIATEPVDEPGRRLRRWKRREYLRIAARDLLGLADLPTVGRELAALAEVCLGAALDLVAPVTPVAVIGM